jgi:hypothetical protein
MPEKPKDEFVQIQRRPSENTPESTPISSLYLELARRVLPEELRLELQLEAGATYGYALAKALFDGAIKGDVRATREIRESIEGKAPQRRNQEGPHKFEVIISYEPPLVAMLPKDDPGLPHE